MPYKNVTTESSPCSDGRLVRMHVRNNTVGLWQIFDFFYDHNGHPYAVKHKIDNAYTTYYYITNLQGDVLGLTTTDGTTVVSYSYDPYGKLLSTTGSKADILGLYNPLRYRGYVYDHETGLYYLQSRYYDPAIGRFINADTFASTGQGILGNNMFAYCLNNPINGCDPCGTCLHRLDFWNDCDKCAGKNAVRKIQVLFSAVSGTLTQGFYLSGSLGFWSGGVQIGGSMDFSGNWECQWAYNAGATTGTPGASVGIFNTITNAPSVEDLHGEGYNIGGEIAAGAGLEVEFVILPNSKKKKVYHGLSLSGGLGGGANGHVVWGETSPIGNLKFNIYDLLEDLIYGG